MFGKANNILGLYCGQGRLSLTLAKGGEVKKSIWVNVPDNIMEGTEIKSENLFAALLKETIKQNGMSCKNVAFAITSDDVFIRNITIPRMTPDQIRINIPFEFRDFIHGELKEYIFDYAYLPGRDGMNEATGEPTMNLVAAAIPSESLESISRMMKKAGLRLVKAAPSIFGYESLLKLLPSADEREKERCFMNIGYDDTRMLIYKNGKYKLTHMIDIGEYKIVQVLADEMNVDMHLAKTYLETNYENCQQLQAVRNTYKDISLEILKGINFYEVSDMTARLGDIVLCGGGAMITPLVALLKERITMNVCTMDELFNIRNFGPAFNITALSYGIVAEEV